MKFWFPYNCGVGVCVGAIILAGCGGSAAPTTPLALQQSQAHAPKHATSSCPCLYVANGYGTVTVYAAGAKGKVAPIRAIGGEYTGLDDPQGVAVDASGNIYVANYAGGPSGEGSVTVYASGATGDVAPTATIGGSYTGLNAPAGIALDPVNGDIYVANYKAGDAGDVTFYAAGSNGNVAPIGTLSGHRTKLKLNLPDGLALDASGNLYVPNLDPASVLVFAAGSVGDVAPTKIISGSKTQLDNPTQATLDSDENLYVANGYYGCCLTEYAADAKGNVRPVRNITGAKTHLDIPAGIALDPSGNTYTTNFSNTVTAYAAGANGNKRPILTLNPHHLCGRKTGLCSPQGIAIR